MFTIGEMGLGDQGGVGCGVWGSGCGVLGSGCRVQGLGLRIQGLGVWAWGCRTMVEDVWFSADVTRFRDQE